ncbi:MAG: hypothetical protein ACTSYI_12435 [Promethearchaeota archaeon]
MKLEKANETVWSIKRKENEGKFILRSTEMGGVVTRVAIALERGDEIIEFDMNLSEFKNFFGILTSFKDMTHNPKGDQSMGAPSMNHMISEDPIPQTRPVSQRESSYESRSPSDFEPNFVTSAPSIGTTASQEQKTPWTPQKDRSDEEEIEELLKSFTSPETPAKKSLPSPSLSEALPTSSSQDAPVSEENNSRRERTLKETDWDPW